MYSCSDFHVGTGNFVRFSLNETELITLMHTCLKCVCNFFKELGVVYIKFLRKFFFFFFIIKIFHGMGKH